MKKLLLTLTFLGLTSAYINAASTFTASVNIENPIVLTETTALSFGTIIPGDVGNTVIAINSSNFSPAVISGSGSVSGGFLGVIDIATNIESAQTVNISITGSSYLTNSVGGQLGINNWIVLGETRVRPSLVYGSSITIVVSFNNQIAVGAVLTVPAKASTGVYTGSYNINASY
jgi:hypothetical protein